MKFEDWMLDKISNLKQMHNLMKERSQSFYSRIKGFEDEIENNRSKGDYFIEVSIDYFYGYFCLYKNSLNN